MNLRPIWSPAAGALSTLSQRFGDIVWPLLFSELAGLQEKSLDTGPPSWMDIELDNEGDDESKREEERSWRDPSAHKLRTVVAKWTRDNLSTEDIVKASDFSISPLSILTVQ